jgi:SAM-dependent methyltransferase
MSWISRSPLLAGANYAKGQILHRLKLRGHFSGSTGLQMSVETAAAYARRVVEDYLTYGADGRAERLEGKHILEVGPGDNLGVALILLAKGAGTVTCVDGFAPSHDDAHNSRIYHAIYMSLSPEEQARVQDVIQVKPDGTASVAGARLISRYDVPMDAPVNPLPSKSFDIVISRAVLEHLRDLDQGWRNMVDCLTDRGEMWHKVDFRCHDFFSEIHPLYFLTVPQRLWEFLSQPDPTLNRRRLPTYRTFASRDFREVDCYITHIFSKQEFFPHVKLLVEGVHYDQHHLDMLEAIRPHLIEDFSHASDEELLVTGIFLIVRDPVRA